MKRPNLDPKIRELMDACRPGSDDVSEPEMTALADLLEQDPEARDTFSRSQQLDRSMGEAFQNVKAPHGLAARLLAAVGAETERSAPTGDLSPASDENVPRRERGDSAHRPRHISRRRLFAVAGSIAATVVIAVYAAVVLNKSEGPVEARTVAEKAIAWVVDIQQGDWISRDKTPLDAYPLANEINLPSASQAVTQWQFVRTVFGKAAAYDLTPAGKGFVYQFAIRTDEEFSAPQLLPPAPHQNTQGMCVGVAYRNGVLYVLVVEGDPQRYEEFIRERLPVI